MLSFNIVVLGGRSTCRVQGETGASRVGQGGKSVMTLSSGIEVFARVMAKRAGRCAFHLLCRLAFP